MMPRNVAACSADTRPKSGAVGRCIGPFIVAFTLPLWGRAAEGHQAVLSCQLRMGTLARAVVGWSCSQEPNVFPARPIVFLAERATHKGVESDVSSRNPCTDTAGQSQRSDQELRDQHHQGSSLSCRQPGCFLFGQP